jgi:osmotically-inducible protein OsmY
LVTAKAKAKLFDDHIQRGVGIRVDTFGGYVILTRAMKKAQQIERATAILKSVYGGARQIVFS